MVELRNGGEKKTIESFNADPSNGSILHRSDKSIKISHQISGTNDIIETYIPIDVIYPVEIEVVSLNKKIYKPEDPVDLSGLQIVLKYNDNTTESINSANITSIPEIGSNIGDNKFIEFSYDLNGKIFKTRYAIEDYYERIDNTNPSQSWQRYLCTFANGSPADMVAMISASRSGYFKMQDYWKIGDERITSYRSSHGSSYTYSDDKNILVIVGFKLPKRLKIDESPFPVSEEMVIISHKRIYNDKAFDVGFYSDDNLRYNTSPLTSNSHINSIYLRTYEEHSDYNSLIGDILYGWIDKEVFKKLMSKFIESLKINKIVLEKTNNGSGGYNVKATISDIIKTKTKYIGGDYNIKFIYMTKEDVFGENAFLYFKIASNRILTNTKNRKIPWILFYDKDVSEKIGESFEYEYIRINDTYKIKAKNSFPAYLAHEYIDENGELQQTMDFWNGKILQMVHRAFIAL